MINNLLDVVTPGEDLLGSARTGNGTNSTLLVVGTIVAVLIILGICVMMRQQRKKNMPQEGDSSSQSI